MLTSATPMLGIACWIINHLAVLVDSFQLPMPRRKELCLTLRPTKNTHCLPPTTYLSSKTIKNITAQQPPPAIAHHILPCTEWQSWHFASVPCENVVKRYENPISQHIPRLPLPEHVRVCERERRTGPSYLPGEAACVVRCPFLYLFVRYGSFLK